MMKILISINPEHVAKILSGEKRFEYRTKAAKKDVDSLIIYETTPVKRIVAEAEILEVLCLSPEDLWKETKRYSGISKSFYDEYFKGRKIAYAYRLGKVNAYDNPLELSDYGIKAAPQSFVYINA
ncbi:MAG: ASCH domain-containing protein [Bacilli bacterium]|nr:ASCH domain-containing protein [Bacilli bacterium]